MAIELKDEFDLWEKAFPIDGEPSQHGLYMRVWKDFFSKSFMSPSRGQFARHLLRIENYNGEKAPESKPQKY